MARGHHNQQGASNDEFKEFVVKINRCATVVKGGRRFSFSALVVVGNQNGKVGIGFGKANEVPQAVQKAVKDAKKNIHSVSVNEKGTLDHQVTGKFRSTKVLLLPAPQGTGVIAGASVRAVVEAVGITDIRTKVHGSTNPINVTKATLDGLIKVRTKELVAQLRGVEL